MRNSTGIWLVVIAAITVLALFMVLADPQIGDRKVQVRYGLDVQGGLRILFAGDEGAKVDAASMDQAKQIVDRRVNALGVVEPVVQVSGNNRIVVELPGITNPEAAISTIKQTGLLEFVDFSPSGGCSAAMPGSGQYILTDKQVALRGGAPAPAATGAATQAATPAATAQATPEGTARASQATAQATAGATAQATAAATAPVVATNGTKENPLLNPCTNAPFTTIMTGAGLQTADAGPGGTSSTQWVVNFTLAGNDESTRFGTHTATHIGQQLAIVLDGQVLSAPTIQAALTSGGQITGNFTQPAAQALALQLRYGALPVSLHVDSTQQVGASLGAESIQASVRAGLIGVLVVLIFMLVYYRLPGGVADIALLLFAAINFALYKFIPITLTLPAMIGFLISVGTAGDGNILILERSKEELRAGRPGAKAIELGFQRAWPSIRDSNISTIIVALIVYFFGGQFGASTVRGFAITLILGLVTNLFTAIIVTHTFMNVVMRIAPERLRQTGLFGISPKAQAEE